MSSIEALISMGLEEKEVLGRTKYYQQGVGNINALIV